MSKNLPLQIFDEKELVNGKLPVYDYAKMKRIRDYLFNIANSNVINLADLELVFWAFDGMKFIDELI